ncbi:MAG: hypothetical protein ABI910_19800 [Gemmatimonadota bacterium]
MNRRTFLAAAGASVAVIASCKDSAGATGDGSEHLKARVTPPISSLAPGQHPLGLASGRDGLLYVPVGYDPGTPLPLVVLLHGAGGTASNWFGSYGDRANANNFVMLAPDSRASSWDRRFGEFGPDVAFLDQALTYVFSVCAIDPQHMALAGFSDGASYALSLGVANGDLFSQLIAYSPGFLTDSTVRGKPQIFESHGLQDTVLPIDVASRPIVARLRNRGYSVDYQEFTGGHEVPPTTSDAAMTWLQAKYHST